MNRRDLEPVRGRKTSTSAAVLRLLASHPGLVLLMASLKGSPSNPHSDLLPRNMLKPRPVLPVDGHPTHTSLEQAKIEKLASKCLEVTRIAAELDPLLPNLLRQAHINYLRKGLVNVLPASFSSLDSSRAWIVYWITHALLVLGKQEIIVSNQERIINTLKSFWNKETGGFGGGPNQVSHLAATYAAVNALVELNSPKALTVIDRTQLYNWLLNLKQEDGSFQVHLGGETDVRGVYCALSVAYLLRIQDEKLIKNCETWILSCQTYEGGFGGVPGGEAHGGYSFCAVATLSLLGSLQKCRIKSLHRWTLNRQMSLEGGFSGRTNKLVDACYSFWQAAVIPIIYETCRKLADNSETDQLFEGPTEDSWSFNQEALQEYILCCCQESIGGLIDKPDKHRDFYHTCYALSGLSIAQYGPTSRNVLGHGGNRVLPVHPVFNVPLESVEFTRTFYEDD